MVLIKAWENGTARFRKMSIEELEAWRSARLATQLSPETTSQLVPQTDTTSLQPDDQTSASDPTPPLPEAGPSMSSIPSVAVPGASTAVFSVSSDGIFQKKVRKTRSDAGKKRGPNVRTVQRVQRVEESNETPLQIL